MNRSLIYMVLLLAFPVTACDQAKNDKDDDDVASGGDDDDAGLDDDTAAGDAPQIANLEIVVTVPENEQEDMLLFSFDFTDTEGDVQGGSVIVTWADIGGLVTGVNSDIEQSDATVGNCDLCCVPFLDDEHLPSGHEVTFTTCMTDRAGNRSNELESLFTIP